MWLRPVGRVRIRSPLVRNLWGGRCPLGFYGESAFVRILSGGRRPRVPIRGWRDPCGALSVGFVRILLGVHGGSAFVRILSPWLRIPSLFVWITVHWCHGPSVGRVRSS